MTAETEGLNCAILVECAPRVIHTINAEASAHICALFRRKFHATRNSAGLGRSVLESRQFRHASPRCPRASGSFLAVLVLLISKPRVYRAANTKPGAGLHEPNIGYLTIAVGSALKIFPPIGCDYPHHFIQIFRTFRLLLPLRLHHDRLACFQGACGLQRTANLGKAQSDPRRATASEARQNEIREEP